MITNKQMSSSLQTVHMVLKAHKLYVKMAHRDLSFATKLKILVPRRTEGKATKKMVMIKV